MYGFCNFEKSPAEIPGIGTLDRMRSHTNHPGVAIGYSTARSAALGDPCDRLGELGLLDRVHVSSTSWVAVAVGNVDEDPQLEVWTIDDHKRLERLAAD